MSLSMTETTIKEFHDTLCKKSLQDIAQIHAQFDYPHPFPILPEEPTRSLINPCVEYGDLIHEMQALQGQMGLLNSVVILPNLPATEIDRLPTLARINMFRGEADLPLIKDIPEALRLARPVELTLSDVTPVRVSELKDIIGWYKRAHLYLEVEAARCKALLLNRHRDPPKMPTGRNEESSKPATTIKQRKRKNHERKNKGVVNGTPSQDSPSSTESGAPVNELTKNTISPDSLAFPTSPTPYAISADPGSSPHPNPIRARSITAREIDLLDSLPSKNRGSILHIEISWWDYIGTENRAEAKNNYHSKEARKHCQAIQCQRKRESRLTVTIPSLSSHIVDPELSSPGPSFETPNNKIQEGKRPLSAPPVIFPSQPETITYTGPPFVNQWN
ncbi:hypothetical protein N7455_005422 [Penicillium solitum]|uniref:uncharacterized protein n=1 Tax=Penicillium solitum TaxID=60172 RepID=UPI0032C3E967|nr:hypothetical protein N7455_005422 [Penicillium solitum]